MSKYEIIIFWSNEDQAYVAEVPELQGYMAHGDTYAKALAEAETAIELWIETAEEFGDPMPHPKGRGLQFAEVETRACRVSRGTEQADAADLGSRHALCRPPDHPPGTARAAQARTSGR